MNGVSPFFIISIVADNGILSLYFFCNPTTAQADRRFCTCNSILPEKTEQKSRRVPELKAGQIKAELDCFCLEYFLLSLDLNVVLYFICHCVTVLNYDAITGM